MTRWLAIISIILTACCPCRKMTVTTSLSEVTNHRDSVFVSHIDTTRVVVRDTVRMMPINQSRDKVVIMATSSYLENEYCTSRANIDELGILTHTLDTRDSASLPVRLIEVTSVSSDLSSHNSKHADTITTDTVEVRQVNYVTWWQRTQIIGFWALIAVLAIKYRKVIFKVIAGWRI